MAPVAHALLARHDEAETRLALTGQHDELVDQALETFGLQPSYDLEIMTEGQSLYDVAHKCLDGIRGVVVDFRPHVLLVQGDTATVCFGALVGYFEGVRVGHVEAGLRTGDKRAPYPEEIFRRIADHVADYHFAPTPRAAAALRREGIDSADVHVTGNTVVDALEAVAKHLGEPRDAVLASAIGDGRRMVLLTAHRRESFGEPLRRIFAAVRELADARDDVVVLYPVHPNPNVRGPAEEAFSRHPRVRLTEPLTYPDLVMALKEAALVLTDSGGIQEEAPTFGTPVVVLRDVTERPEGVEAGVARLAGTDPERIVTMSNEWLDSGQATGHRQPNPYGDGHAGERIADILLSTLTGVGRRTRDWKAS